MVTISGGAKLQRALDEIARKIGDGAELRVGFLENATYPVDADNPDDAGKSVAMVAAAQNFGTSRIPPRPFFSNMVKDKSPDWPRKLGNVLKQADYDVNLALGRMGEGIKGQLQQSIHETNAPPLAESTIARKGFAKPLIDTSHMLNSVDSEVRGLK